MHGFALRAMSLRDEIPRFRTMTTSTEPCRFVKITMTSTVVPATANAVQLLLPFFPWVSFAPSSLSSPTANFLPPPWGLSQEY